MELQEITYEVLATGDKMPSGYYLKTDVDAVLAEKDKEIEELKGRLASAEEDRDYFKNIRNKRHEEEIAELKQKLGAVNELVKESKELLKESQKMHQKCTDNASKQIRRLKRALYKACAEWALSTLSWLDCIDQGSPVKWGEMRRKCLEKVEEFK